jgi:hypothetical protein
MAIRGTTSVACPACGKRTECELVQSINTRTQPEDKQRLLAGNLNVLSCECGKRTQLAVKLLFHDPDADYFCQVVPGDERAMEKAASAFAAAGANGSQRLVPTLNALIEKVKILDAGLLDWAVEMNKVLLLAAGIDQRGEQAMEHVLLFDGRDDGLLHWIRFDEQGRAPERVSSPLASYTRLAERTHGQPKRGELRIDRAWAVAAVHEMIAGAN